MATDSRYTPPWSRHLRREVQLILDGAVLVAAFLLSYLIRFEFEVPAAWVRWAAMQLPFVVLLQALALYLAGVYRFVWRYVGLQEVAAFVRAACWATLPVLVARLAFPESFKEWRMPLSVIVLDGILAFGGILSLRVLRRTLYEKYERDRRHAESPGRRLKAAVLAGAGRAGVMVAREIKGRGDLGIEPIGFVDDDPEKKEAVIHGLRVLGTLADLDRLILEQHVEEVVITMAEVSAETVRRVVGTCERLGVRPRIMPGLYEILGGQIAFSRFRDVQIEDLLGREQVTLDDSLTREFLGGRSVLVTGAGGSIGSELVRQIARFAPREIVLVERAEGALFEIDREARRIWPRVPFHAVVGDVGDLERMRAVMVSRAPDVILHAAAHKHVPLMEVNASDAVKNNVLATRSLAELAGEEKVEAFVLISTDKAVRPSSVMGATKRVAELIVQDAQQRYPLTRFVAVRFGNVAGSAGSVIPIFREQIGAGGPVTVTHPEATRYFMTISEAGRLVLEAGAIGQSGQIMILDMGKPIRIVDLAEDMIRLSGLRPHADIAIEFTGLRPGEKVTEELRVDADEVAVTSHSKIFVGKVTPCPSNRLQFALTRMADLARRGDDPGLRSCLAQLLPESSLAGASTEAGSPGRVGQRSDVAVS